jgi:hypothetical protein
MTIPVSFATIGWKTYIYYAVFNAAFVPILYFFMVETKGRSLEELDVIFATPDDPAKNEKRLPHDISVADARVTLGLEEAKSEQGHNLAEDLPHGSDSIAERRHGRSVGESLDKNGVIDAAHVEEVPEK